MSWQLTPKRRRPALSQFIMAPYLSVRSLKFHVNLRSFSFFKDLLIFSFLLTFLLLLTREYLLPLNYGKVLLISPGIYFLTEVLGSLGQFLFSGFKKTSFPIHYAPLRSLSLSQFWGRRWNLWVQDWLKDISGAFKGRASWQRVLITFLISGVFHELMVNLPYWLMYRKSYFGSMMLYFSVQSLGLWIDKRFLKHHPTLRIIWLWLVVILPSPLFINTPLLHFAGLVHD